MNLGQDIKPVSHLKARADVLLRQVNETRRPVIITQNGEPKAVLQDLKSYEKMREAIGILKAFSQGEASIADGKSRSQQEVFEKLEKDLKDKMK